MKITTFISLAAVIQSVNSIPINLAEIDSENEFVWYKPGTWVTDKSHCKREIESTERMYKDLVKWLKDKP